ncbi:hypothetical protein [Phaffia rhodozyma]|uniref:Uncharacterized protein n=1 Tax=Phaffia rhodozyma TaxID=264483 RepID=A0A0F7SJN2_PHARH|nr:hypothetical protein [Phaffia rhodozyma]
MMVHIDSLQLEAHLLTIDLLQSMFPLPSELLLSPGSAETLAILRSLSSPIDSLPTPVQDEIRLLLRIGLIEEDNTLELDIKFSLRIGLTSIFYPDQLPTTATSSLGSTGVSSPTVIIDEDDPTSVILQLVEEIKTLGQEYIPSSRTLGSTSSSEAKRVADKGEGLGGSAEDQVEMFRVRDALICVSKMHHIVNQPKLRKLKALATSSGASGFVKSGRPGILLYEIGSKEDLAKFLEGVRSLKYLEFHHLTAESLYPPSYSPYMHNSQSASLSESTSQSIQSSSQPLNEHKLLNEGKPGLIELDEVKDLLDIAEKVGRREWFREAIGMGSTGKKSR